ncbi:hypothetical protein Tco_0324370 [Tanacetum coccineum]
MGKTNLSHDGLNPAHVPYWWVNNPTLGEFCFTMIGRADIEGSKSNVAMNAWLPQASYPCGNFSDTSSFKFRRSKGSLGHAFTVRIRTGNQNQTSFYPSVPHEISVLVELILGHLLRFPFSRTSSSWLFERPWEGPRKSRSQSVPRPARGDPLSPREQLEQSADSRRVRNWDPRAQPSIANLSLDVTDPLCRLPCLQCSIDQRLFTWRPDAVMSTTGRGRHLSPDFQGPPGAHRTPRDVRCSSSRWTLPPTESFPGWAGVKQKR